ncbi:MAG: glycosyltransferase family 2 protein, partial [Candidatus Heimdallarchaeota archaeon]
MALQLGVILWFLGGFFFLLCTSYYIFELIPAYLKHRKSYLNPEIPSDEEILALLETSQMSFPIIKFQITTRGKEVDVVKRSVDSIARLAERSPLFEKHIELLIVTDELSEVEFFSKHFKAREINFPAEVVCVPKGYKTPNGTLLKARSLQYSIEYRKNNGSKSQNTSSTCFIFYFDAESTITEDDFRRVVHSILTNPEKKIFEGGIIYPHKYFNAHILSRQMESSRPFNCYHCVQVMKNPPPLHLHGSNLLVEENLVNSIGWDFGKVGNRPVLAEDLVFGLKAYSRYGSQPFGWHGGRIYEQPPFSIRASINARLRWITGAWQALVVLKTQSDFLNLPWRKRMWVQARIRARIITHSLSFFAAFFVILSIFIFIFPTLFSAFHVDFSQLSPDFRTFIFIVSRFVFLPGTVFWIFGVINGSFQNIEPLNLSRW